MRDVEDQLRIYGDSILDGDDVATVSAPPRRRSLVFASAAIVVIAALAGALLVAGDDQREHSAVHTVSPSPETKHGPKVTAELHLDKNVVHRGGDVTGNITFRNRTGAQFVARVRGTDCLPRWAVSIGRTRRLARVAETPDCPRETSPRTMVLAPGVTTIPFTVPTVYMSCGGREALRCPREGEKAPDRPPLLPPQHTKVWLSAGSLPVGPARPLRIVGPPRVPFCTSRDVTASDTGQLAKQSGVVNAESIRGLFVLPTGPRSCQLDGVPEIALVTSTGARVVMPTAPEAAKARALRPRRFVIARNGRIGGAAIWVRVDRDPNSIARCKALRIQVVLPDQGGTVNVRSNLEDLCTATLTPVSGFRPLRPSKRHPTRGP